MPDAMLSQNLKTLSRIHGGKYIHQAGFLPGQTRDYWLIAQSLNPSPVGAITRSTQIHESWAHQRELKAGQLDTFSRYSLIYVTKGRGIFRDDRHREALPVAAGDVICVFPGIPHAYGPPESERWDEINVEFSGIIFDAWIGAGLLDPAIPVRHLPQPVDYWLKRFHDVVLPLAAHSSGADYTLRDAGRLTDLLAEICNTWQEPHAKSDLRWIDEARTRLLALAPDAPLDLAAEGRAFNLGEQAYRKKFKRLCGVTPNAFRSRHLIEQACHQLIASDVSVKALAFAYGFSTPFSFSRHFKQFTGLSPERYRENALR
ncbi:DNA-binding domain-containing protein, AraC-type [Opitutaceae bacterium TAV1]|nr:DNA-binding domain-containing protein, AraC-type [Opitutaceae bacterium TAV1]